MAKIDYNAVLEGGYEVRVGNEYELAEGKWGINSEYPRKLTRERLQVGKGRGYHRPEGSESRP
jgi:hypothetical protein